MSTDKKHIVSWEDVSKMITVLALALRFRKIERIVAIARGGLVPAAMLAHALNIRDVHSLKVVSYTEDGRKLGKPELDPDLLASQQYVFNDPSTLFVEDIVDSGDTVAMLMERFPRCTVAALITRRSACAIPDYMGELTPSSDWFVFPWEVPAVVSPV